MCYEISSEGVKPEQKHVQKLLQLQPPKDVKEVEAFIGLINYFGQMIPTYAAKTRCINELRLNDKLLKGTDECQRSFLSLVDELTSEPLVKPYSLDKEVTLSTDASEKTIGAVLTQNDHPVIYISRNLTSAEQKYSNIEWGSACCSIRSDTTSTISIGDEVHFENRLQATTTYLQSEQPDTESCISDGQ